MDWTITFPNFVGNYDGNEKETIHIGHPFYADFKASPFAPIFCVQQYFHHCGSQFLPEADRASILHKLSEFGASNINGVLHH